MTESQNNSQTWLRSPWGIILLMGILCFAVQFIFTRDALHTHSHHMEGSHSKLDPEINRRMGYSHFNEGNAALKKGDWKKAVQDYKKALGHDAQFTEAQINLSTAYLKKGNLDGAFSLLKTLESREPGNPFVHYNLACYYSLVRKIPASFSALKQAISLGFKRFSEIQEDPDLKNLREDSEFKKWVQQVSHSSG